MSKNLFQKKKQNGRVYRPVQLQDQLLLQLKWWKLWDTDSEMEHLKPVKRIMGYFTEGKLAAHTV